MGRRFHSIHCDTVKNGFTQDVFFDVALEQQEQNELNTRCSLFLVIKVHPLSSKPVGFHSSRNEIFLKFCCGWGCPVHTHISSIIA